MSEPTTFTRTKDEAIQAVQDWMRLHNSDVLATFPDWYYARLGLLIDCITDLHTPTFTVVQPEKESA